MNKLSRVFILPSAAFTLTRKQIKGYIVSDKPPEIGDAVYGSVETIGQHNSLENSFGRIHNVHKGTKAIFVFGNRYAPDYYEGLVPETFPEEVDLLARSGVIGIVKTKSSKVIDPTRVRLLGYACDENGKILNTRDYPIIKLKNDEEKKFPRAKLILVCGTAMNSGKSMAAIACCLSLNALGYKVRASKVTGTASLKDILGMNDAGADPYADFSYLGYPSTYMLSKEEMLAVFNTLDLKYANNKDNYWVVELADGIMQRETAMLLKSPEVKQRIHRLVFCAADAFGAIGGLSILNTRFGLAPHAISGVCSSSPLHVQELQEFTDIPIFNSLKVDVNMMQDLLV